MPTKRCTKCGEEKSLERFSYKLAGQPARRSACKDCGNTERRAWRENPSNREKNYQASQRWHRRTKYGLDDDTYRAMLIAQDGKCAICAVDISGKPFVDHCHTTGCVRALLCCNCNVALGMLNDDPERARAAADYLEAHRD